MAAYLEDVRLQGPVELGAGDQGDLGQHGRWPAFGGVKLSVAEFAVSGRGGAHDQVGVLGEGDRGTLLGRFGEELAQCRVSGGVESGPGLVEDE